MAETSSTIPALQSKTDYLRAVAYEGVTVLESTAPWCAQCKAIAPEVEKMVSEFPDVHFFTYDIDECGDIAHELGVSQMPTFTLFRDGDLMDGVSGARAGEVRKAIEKCVGGK